MNVGRAKVSRTMDVLKNTKVLLNNVQHITIAYESKKAGNSGTRNFLYEYVPAIRYHNPSVSFSVLRDKKGTGLSVIQGNGQTVKVATLGQDADSILRQLITATASQDQRKPDPLQPEWLRQKRVGKVEAKQ